MGAPRPEPSLRSRALAWLAQREHSRQELRGKLLREAARRARVAASAAALADAALAAPPAEADTDTDAVLSVRHAEVDALLDWLAERGYLSDQRFAESRVLVRGRQWGQRRIEHELRQHGLALPADTRAALQGTELERARALWARRFGRPPADPAERARQMRFLAGRGFAGDTIRRVLRDAGDAGHDDPAAGSSRDDSDAE